MASLICWRCLSRPSCHSIPLRKGRTPLHPLTITSTSPFSTTPIPRKGPPPAKVVRQSFALKKKAIVKSKPPGPGERKAMRKRVVLSNGNALEVEGMVDLAGKNIADERRVGSVVGLQDNTVDSLRAVEAFRASQSWGLFRRPGVLVRREGCEVGTLIERVGGASSEGKEEGKEQAEGKKEVQTMKETLRLVIDGNKGTGKSLLLLHAMAMAFVKDWIVINIPEAQELITASTAYAPLENTNPKLYSQPAYTSKLLSQIAKANPILNTLELSLQHNLSLPLQSNITFLRLCELGARDPDMSWPIFQAFWREITAPGRPPIFFALDGLAHIMSHSAYRNAEYQPIHSHDLALIRHFADHLSGDKTLPNGGAVIAATSRSHTPISKSMDLLLTQQIEKQEGREQLTKRDPYEKKYDERAEKAFKDVRVIMLKGLSKGEARGLMEYWAKSGVFRKTVDEASLAEKWALAGHGVVGEMERGALEMRI